MANKYWRGGTGTWNGTNTANWAAAATAATFTASQATTVLTVTAVASGTITNGDTVWHTNGTSLGTITSFGTGTGGTGTYNMSASATVTSRTMSSATVGSAVPGATDDVIFDVDSNVGTATCTVTAATATALCNNFTASGLDGALTFAGSIGLTISGNLSVPASNFTRTFTGAITFNATATGKTIASNGVTWSSAITFNGVGGGWTLSDALSNASTVTLTNGSLSLSTFTLTATTFSSTNTNTRTLDYGTGKIVLTGNSGTIFNTGTPTGLTISGTPQVDCTYSGATGTRTIAPAALAEGSTTSFSITAGTDIVVFSSSSAIKSLTFTGFSGSWSNVALTIYGNLTVSTGMTVSAGANVITMAATSGTQNITSNGKTLDFPVTFNGVGGTFKLIDAMTLGSTRTATFTNGTLDLNSLTLTCAIFSSANSNTRVLAFGTGKISTANSGATIINMTGSGFTFTGTSLIECTYSGAVGTRTITMTGFSVAGSLNLSITAGTDIVALTTAATLRNLIFTGFAGTHTLVATTLVGNLTFSTGMTVTAAAVTHTYAATSGTQTITSNGKTYGCSITQSGAGGTVALADALTLTATTGTYTLTNGALDLGTFTATMGIFSSNNSNTRSITFGAGAKFVLNASGATIYAVNTATNMTISGTSRVECTYSGAVGTRVVNNGGTGTGSASNAPNVYVTAGTDTFTLSGDPAAWYGTVDFTGFAGTFTNATRNLSGSLVISTGMTVSAGATTTVFAATSGTKTITSNGKTLDFPITVNGVGGIIQLADALTMGSGRLLTLTAGTLDINDLTLTAGTFSGTGSTARTLDFGTGSLVVVGAGASAFDATTITNLTVTYSTGAKVSMTNAAAKTFIGGGASWPKLEQAGAGALTITGSNTFSDITNTTQPVSVLFTAGTTSTFSAFSLSGTLGNLVTIGSVTAASHALSKTSGTVSVSYCTISRSDAAGGASWLASTTNGNVDGGNNTGWNFASLSATNRPLNVAMINAGVATLDQFSPGTAFMGWGN